MPEKVVSPGTTTNLSMIQSQSQSEEFEKDLESKATDAIYPGRVEPLDPLVLSVMEYIDSPTSVHFLAAEIMSCH